MSRSAHRWFGSGKDSIDVGEEHAASHAPIAEEEVLRKSSSTLGDMSRGALTLRSLLYPLPFELSAGLKSEGVATKLCVVVYGFSCSRHHDWTPLCARGSAPRTAASHWPCHWRTKCAMHWCCQFAFITGVFGGTKCLVETFRGKKDVWNVAMGGCVTGAAMSAKQGNQVMAFGCGGFATFSFVADQDMESMDMH
eukprot:scaffold188160_cov81-Attheya_sp.AAC.1